MIISAQGDLIISMDYSPNALDWADLYDNRCIAWEADVGAPVIPVVVGKLPTDRSADTPPVISPQWVDCSQESVIVPDLWRGSLYDFFTWLATNNGATRKLRGKFLNNQIVATWESWKARNPNLVR